MLHSFAAGTLLDMFCAWTAGAGHNHKACQRSRCYHYLCFARSYLVLPDVKTSKLGPVSTQDTRPLGVRRPRFSPLSMCREGKVPATSQCVLELPAVTSQNAAPKAWELPGNNSGSTPNPDQQGTERSEGSATRCFAVGCMDKSKGISLRGGSVLSACFTCFQNF